MLSSRSELNFRWFVKNSAEVVNLVRFHCDGEWLYLSAPPTSALSATATSYITTATNCWLTFTQNAMLDWCRWTNPAHCALPFQRLITVFVNLCKPPLCFPFRSVALISLYPPSEWCTARLHRPLKSTSEKIHFPHQQMFLIWTHNKKGHLHCFTHRNAQSVGRC